MQGSRGVMMIVAYHAVKFLAAPGTSMTPTIGMLAYFCCDATHNFSVTWLTLETAAIFFARIANRHVAYCVS